VLAAELDQIAPEPVDMTLGAVHRAFDPLAHPVLGAIGVLQPIADPVARGIQRAQYVDAHRFASLATATTVSGDVGNRHPGRP